MANPPRPPWREVAKEVGREVAKWVGRAASRLKGGGLHVHTDGKGHFKHFYRVKENTDKNYIKKFYRNSE